MILIDEFLYGYTGVLYAVILVLSALFFRKHLVKILTVVSFIIFYGFLAFSLLGDKGEFYKVMASIYMNLTSASIGVTFFCLILERNNKK